MPMDKAMERSLAELESLLRQQLELHEQLASLLHAKRVALAGANHRQVTELCVQENKRIQAEVKDGQISKGQAAALHSEDHQIRTEERDMAGQNNTHITTQEQKTLNQQENAVSGQIGKQK